MIDANGLTIGREGTLRLNSEKASGVHARVFLRDGRAILAHLSKTNSTLINGQAVIGEQELLAGSRFQIARGGEDEFIVDAL